MATPRRKISQAERKERDASMRVLNWVSDVREQRADVKAGPPKNLSISAGSSIHPRLPHHPPHPTATHSFRPRIHTRPVRRQAPTGSPLP